MAFVKPAEIPTPPLSDADKRFSFDDEDAGRSRTLRYERKMGDTELSYFLPSRQSGVNDMYLHLGFKAKERVVKRARVSTVWAILRLRHPLMCARAEMHDYDDVRFVYHAPQTAEEAYLDADANLEYRTQPKDELIDTYLNGPRTLSNSRLSYLILSGPHSSPAPVPTPPRTPSPSDETRELGEQETRDDDSERARQYDLLICAMHFLGDGMALHQFANDFFSLLAGERSDDALAETLREEWRARWGATPASEHVLPAALEDNMPLPPSPFRRAAAAVDFQLAQQRLVGGQTFPKRRHAQRETVVPTVSFPADRTRAILARCKAHGVSISAALFAVCDVAWARLLQAEEDEEEEKAAAAVAVDNDDDNDNDSIGKKKKKKSTTGTTGRAQHPVLMYSALNLRPYFTTPPAASYWYLAIGYFNVVLPAFLPPHAGGVEAQARTFWLRARQAKEQSARAAKSPLVASRTLEMARERGARARVWAREDDERERGTWVAPTPAESVDADEKEEVLPARAKAPAAALIGLSLLGNLDGIYRHAAFPGAELHTLTTGSRQRHGAMLLFGYTFKGKLWISLGYDRNGFAGDVVDRFWKQALDCVEEFLG